MGKKAIVKYLQFLTIIISFVALILTIIGLYGGDVNPTGNEMKALLAFGLPILIIINVVILIYWIIRLKIWVIIPIVSLLICWNYIGTIFRFDSRPDGADTEPGIIIASYNVAAFQHEITGYKANDVKSILSQENASIVCFQEFNDDISANGTTVTAAYKDLYPYSIKGIGGQVIFSRYPIKRGETIKFQWGGSTNSAQWADININGKNLRVYNVHLLTTSVNQTLHSLAKSGEDKSINEKAAIVINGWEDQFKYRAAQTDELSNVIRMSDNNSTKILCGDFNDTPYTYSYKRILSNGLVDGFVTAGHGFMSTYRGAKGLLRIDYIFHSEDIKGLDYYTKDVDLSDHNPVFFKIKMPK